MTIVTRVDLQNIYKNSLKPPELLDRFLRLLDELAQNNEGRALLKTRNEENKPLKYSSTIYFDFLDPSKPKQTQLVFAGDSGGSPSGPRVPVVRVRDSIPLLEQIPSVAKFPFQGNRSEPWTNVIISSNTIELLPSVLNAAIESFFHTQGTE